jgi:hypothetical protein
LRAFSEPLPVPAGDRGTVAFHVEIEMPDRQSAFSLEDDLRALYPLAVGRRGEWSVVIDDEEDHLDEVVEASRHWLQRADLDDLVLRVGRHELHVHA